MERRQRKRRSPLWAKIMVVFGAILMVAGGGAFVAGKVAQDKVNEAVGQDDLLGEGARSEHEVDLHGPLNYLLVGSDQRVNSTKPGLADTIIVLHIPEGMDRAFLVSIPRDTWLEIDCNGNVYYSKINASYTCGGTDRGASFKSLSEAVHGLTGLTFDGGAIVDFEGFANVVGVIGTVELCLEKTITSIHTGKTFEKGCARYGKDDALDIVRQRYQYADGDYARQRMQQQFIKNLLREAIAQGYVTDVTKVGDLLAAVGQSLTVDTNGIDPVDLAYALRGISPESMTMVRVPSDVGTVGDQSVINLIEPDAQGLWDAIAADEMDAWAPANPEYINTGKAPK
ncbi:LCP family protein [Phytomonospora endophytica]|uniref:LCP family protein required for cell wall assembly n=1 Tax=Phytomonospora endophytica TaxID=714109 RepID=A0A841FNF7_9ACTN|nr:LCP family protein [Phytomonospora endophytica]MBB6035092.1 LCP family protein required for cell wall assembly [Phytomonospora endophytica]GIG64159.1 transcriptional regulator [Phytomonospora endophytica]